MPRKPTYALFGPPTFAQFCSRWGYSPPTKVCSMCGVEKDRRQDFYQNGKKATSRCKVCDNRIRLERRKHDASYPDKRRAWNAKPEAVAHRREYEKRPEVRARVNEYKKRPEVKARKRLRAEGIDPTPEEVVARVEYTKTIVLIQEIQHVCKQLCK